MYRKQSPMYVALFILILALAAGYGLYVYVINNPNKDPGLHGSYYTCSSS